HHGAGSRQFIAFWDEEADDEQFNFNKKIKLNSSKLLFNDFDRYISWLRGQSTDAEFNSVIISQNPRDGGSRTPNRPFINIITKQIFKYFALKNNNKSRTSKGFHDNMSGIPSENYLETLPKPLGWENSFPDIVGIGVPKAGTSWWFDNLLSHPHIVPHRFYDKQIDTSKELHFFTHIGHHKINEYQKNIYKKCFFKQYGVFCSEFSSIYFQHIGSLNNLLNTVEKNTVFVLLLRNPVDRYISHINHVMLNRSRRLGIKDSNLQDFFKKYSVVPEAAFYSIYADSLELLLSRIERKKIFIDFYENFSKNPEQSYRNFIDFIGLPQYYINNFDYRKPKNTQEYIIGKPNEEERVIIAKQFKHDLARLKKLLPEVNIWNNS
ncbi:MAG: sulfotransferase domain-containing protein, partial [Candidatus Omnitrophica bacterium]|nr:sulfotransferase domain-containing protein [Candidatus Omnitrophota bacterium]